MEYKIYLFKRFGIIYYAVRDDDNIFARKDDNILFNLAYKGEYILYSILLMEEKQQQ